jgi:hypothetical protein
MTFEQWDKDRKDAIEIIDDIIATLRKGWCKFAFARDADQNNVPSTDEKAVCWCLSGAENKALKQRQGLGGHLYWGAKTRQFGDRGLSMPYYNDNKCNTVEDAIEPLLRMKESLEALVWEDDANATQP